MFKERLKILFLIFTLFSLAIIVKLFYWQIILGDKLSAQAKSQYSIEQEIPATRGKIFSSDGYPLVTNVEAYQLYAILPQIKDKPNTIAKKIKEIIPEANENEIKDRLENQELIWMPLIKKINRHQKESLEQFEIEGIGFEKFNERLYSEASMSANLLGFVGKDEVGKNKGYFGLEGFYDRSLVGKPGFLSGEKDASGMPILVGNRKEELEVPGRDLELYLDRRIQFLVETKLKEGMSQFEAKAATAIVMDPKTGGILAMASYPNFDPTTYALWDSNYFTNQAISQTFEPGSIFKPIVMASAIEEKSITKEELCTDCNGPKSIGEYTIRTWDEKYHPNSTMTEILEHSDNVGMVYVVRKLGLEKTLKYIKKFGFGKETGIDLEGEANVPLRDKKDWAEVDLATASFGQGIAVTPIQMVAAISSIANGGFLVEPHVVSKIYTEDKIVEIKPTIKEKVISPSTARIVTEMMVSAAENGGKWKRPEGFKIAGKTGTAQIPIAGHYDKEKTIVSFIGFAPAENPRFVMLVTLKEPTITWGGMTAAPLWFDIAGSLFFYLGITPK